MNWIAVLYTLLGVLVIACVAMLAYIVRTAWKASR